MSKFSKCELVIEYLRNCFNNVPWFDYKIEKGNIVLYYLVDGTNIATFNVEELYNSLSEKDIRKLKIQINSEMINNSDQKAAAEYAAMIKKEIGE